MPKTGYISSTNDSPRLWRLTAERIQHCQRLQKRQRRPKPPLWGGVVQDSARQIRAPHQPLIPLGVTLLLGGLAFLLPVQRPPTELAKTMNGD
jgi:hypothetical protein